MKSNLDRTLCARWKPLDSQTEINNMPKKVLTEAQEARRKATVRKARSAAIAAGKDWKMLTSDERRAFRQQVRMGAKGEQTSVRAASTHTGTDSPAGIMTRSHPYQMQPDRAHWRRAVINAGPFGL